VTERRGSRPGEASSGTRLRAFAGSPSESRDRRARYSRIAAPIITADRLCRAPQIGPTRSFRTSSWFHRLGPRPSACRRTVLPGVFAGSALVHLCASAMNAGAWRRPRSRGLRPRMPPCKSSLPPATTVRPPPRRARPTLNLPSYPTPPARRAQRECPRAARVFRCAIAHGNL